MGPTTDNVWAELLEQTFCCIVSKDSDLLVVLLGFECMCWGQSKPMGEGDRIRTRCIFASQGLSQRHVSWREVKPVRGPSWLRKKAPRVKRRMCAVRGLHQILIKLSVKIVLIWTMSPPTWSLQKPFCSQHTLSYWRKTWHDASIHICEEQVLCDQWKMFKIDLTESLLTNSHRCHCDFQTHSVWRSDVQNARVSSRRKQINFHLRWPVPLVINDLHPGFGGGRAFSQKVFPPPQVAREQEE